MPLGSPKARPAVKLTIEYVRGSQRSVASQLGLPHVAMPFYNAAGPNGLLRAALEMSCSLAAPLMNPWLPAYHTLATEAERRGCRVILTGGGGDEWLTISPFLSADLLRAFDLRGVYRLWDSIRRSYRRPSLALLRSLLWRFGARPLLLPPARRVVGAIAPWALQLRRRMVSGPPKWIAPDGALRRELDLRLEEHSARARQVKGSFYIKEVRTALDHPLVSWESEEVFEIGRRLGVRVLRPFWDADLVDLLYRTPPFLLNQGGRNKGLVRESLARRFPNLGFEQQKKVDASHFYTSLMLNEASPAWRAIGGAARLGDLGIVDNQRLPPAEQTLARQEPRASHGVWTLLNAEAWVRAHT